ncbi:Hypothetical predicted protein [Cloeon dipterum]|uniref:AttH domain-containing protein n=1 Tax=Cloeon dipterum TaxID=197152 RepID=A0A8S1BV60_9INSE|nr:Hypothetical predicted protein [Cloeon dipterum]
MKPLLCTVIVIFVAIVASTGHRVYEPPTTTSKPESVIYYDEEPMEGNVSSITETPPGDLIPANISSSIFGSECTIFSVAYPDQYLIMKSGIFHYYAELTRGNPKPAFGEWDWRGIWRINSLDFLGDLHFQFWNHKTETLLTYNATRYSFVRGTGKIDIVDNLWNINNIDGTTVSTIQHLQHPGGYLHALTSTRSGSFDQLPMNVSSDIFGLECTIHSIAYPDEYLVMKSGLSSYHQYYAELKKGDPKPKYDWNWGNIKIWNLWSHWANVLRDGEWDWSGIWKISRLDFSGDQLYQLWNHKTKTFFTNNATSFSHLELLNVTTTIFGAECTIQSVAYPSQYLVMKSGLFHSYPELSRVTLKPDNGAWDWSGIWKINIVKISLY